MGDPPTPKVEKDIFEKLGSDTLKFFPLGLAAIYITGFIIVALHLAGYGASPLNLIRVQYLTAGFWFYIFVALYLGLKSLMCTYLGDLNETWETPLSKRTMGLLASVTTVFTLSVMGISVGYLAQRTFGGIFHKLPSQNLGFWAKTAALAVIGLGMFDFFLQIFWSLRFKKNKKKAVLHRVLLWAFLVLSLMTACLGLQLCIREFAQRIYANIPFSLGGGQPRQVIFWLGSSAPDSFLERDGTNPYTVPYELLVENEDTLVVISPKANQRIIQFDRKSIEGMVVLGTRPPSAPAHFQRGVTEDLKPLDSTTTK